MIGEIFWNVRQMLWTGTIDGDGFGNDGRQIDLEIQRFVERDRRLSRTNRWPALWPEDAEPLGRLLTGNGMAPYREMRIFWGPLALAFAETEEEAQPQRIRLLRERGNELAAPFEALLISLQRIREIGGWEVLRLWRAVPGDRFLDQPPNADDILEAVHDEIRNVIDPIIAGRPAFALDMQPQLLELLALLHQQVRHPDGARLHQNQNFWARALLWVLAQGFLRFKDADCRNHKRDFISFVEGACDLLNVRERIPGEELFSSFFAVYKPQTFPEFYMALYQEFESVIRYAQHLDDGEREILSGLHHEQCYLRAIARA